MLQYECACWGTLCKYMFWLWHGWDLEAQASGISHAFNDRSPILHVVLQSFSLIRGGGIDLGTLSIF